MYFERSILGKRGHRGGEGPQVYKVTAINVSRRKGRIWAECGEATEGWREGTCGVSTWQVYNAGVWHSFWLPRHPFQRQLSGRNTLPATCVRKELGRPLLKFLQFQRPLAGLDTWLFYRLFFLSHNNSCSSVSNSPIKCEHAKPEASHLNPDKSRTSALSSLFLSPPAASLCGLGHAGTLQDLWVIHLVFFFLSKFTDGYCWGLLFRQNKNH